MLEPNLSIQAGAVRDALAREAYRTGAVRLADPDLDGADWLVATHRGIFSIAGTHATLAVHGWFFGLCRHDGCLFVFENCGRRDRTSDIGRVIRFDMAGGMLSAGRVLITGLDNNCHQLAVIAGLLCVVDTANQAILRYTLDGTPVDVQRPFPPARPSDRSGAYVHLNSIAEVGERIGCILHNGKAVPDKNSEIAWLDRNWQVQHRAFLPGHHCHDIVEDEAGRLWHCLSQEGEILRSDGLKIRVTDHMMTRGIALTPERLAVGTATFGPRHLRGKLNGAVVLLERTGISRVGEIRLPAAPTDIIAL